MRGRYVRRSALFSTQPVQLALEPRDLDGAGQQPGSDAASEDDEHNKDQRGFEAAREKAELDIHRVLNRQQQQSQENGDADDPADDLHQ